MQNPKKESFLSKDYEIKEHFVVSWTYFFRLGGHTIQQASHYYYC